MKTNFAPVAWDTVHRMREHGCALDLNYLYRLYSPVRVFSDPSRTPVAIAPLEDGFILCMHVQLVATLPVTITRMAVAADWFPSPVQWAQRCAEHPGHYCLHPHFCQPGDQMLNSWLLYHRRALKRGLCIEGLLLGHCVGAAPKVAPGSRLEANLVLQDGNGYRYRYPILVAEGLPAKAP